MISEAYKRVLEETRELDPTWGGARRHAAPVLSYCELHGLERGTVLDYGAGRGRFAEELERIAPGRYIVSNYEPAIAHYSELPAGPFDVVVCTHVLEHVEPELLVDTLAEIRARARKFVYMEIPHGPAGRVLSDGRNAHLIQEPPVWWIERMKESFFPFVGIHAWPAVNPLNTIFVCHIGEKACAEH